MEDDTTYWSDQVFRPVMIYRMKIMSVAFSEHFFVDETNFS